MTLSIAVGLPCALALFPQTATLSTSELEEPLRQLAEPVLMEEAQLDRGVNVKSDAVLFPESMNVLFTKGV